ncbi:L-fucose dehydrogenase isoform X2 [Gorilla gorilla gorilla]|uniref:L-fucose dehydrogenase isoform X2 n=1 Tax=Gorilla gorilla gorilla TaxID=9595 RepID=UPI002445906B|nr:17-beta-hydroxysteroid dehydrogenase 14 isoform X3 [Gorilla gorilla gorilla]
MFLLSHLSKALSTFNKWMEMNKSLKTLVSETIRRFGRLDCVVNNAGHHPPPQRPEETSAQGFRQLLELNLLGTYTLTKLALPYLRKSQGNVINISSLVGAIGQAQAVPYVATKGAVTAMTKALALDESPYGVRVNCISPGNIWTPLWEELAALTPDPRATIREGMLAQPLGRMGQPAEVGAAAVFLASEANFCTGIELLVTGGAELGYGRKASRSTPVDAPDIPS